MKRATMSKYQALVRLEFTDYVEVEAKNKEEAENKIWAMLSTDDIDPINDFEPNTEVCDVEKI